MFRALNNEVEANRRKRDETWCEGCWTRRFFSLLRLPANKHWPFQIFKGSCDIFFAVLVYGRMVYCIFAFRDCGNMCVNGFRHSNSWMSPPWRRSIMQPTHWSNPGTDLAKSSRECSRCWCSGIFFCKLDWQGNLRRKRPWEGVMIRQFDTIFWLILKSITCTWLWREFPDVSIVRSNFPYKCRQGYLQSGKHLHHINHISINSWWIPGYQDSKVTQTNGNVALQGAMGLAKIS